MKYFFCTLAFITFCFTASFAQSSYESGNVKRLFMFQDSLKSLGSKMINDDNDLERKNANYAFIKTLVTALKTPQSFKFPFDSVKSISILNSTDNRFRIFSWSIMNKDGSYRFFGAIQMNSGENLVLHPFEDYTPMIKNPEDTITDNRKWYGAQYYKIIPVFDRHPYYVLLGWKGNTVKSNKKVIEVLSFKDGKPQLGLPIFDGNGKTRNRIVFEYTRQASLLLRYVPDQHLIVFDELAPPDKKMKDKLDSYGPDMNYNGYRLKEGRWHFVQNLDMRNVPESRDADLVDPKQQALRDRSSVPVKH